MSTIFEKLRALRESDSSAAKFVPLSLPCPNIDFVLESLGHTAFREGQEEIVVEVLRGSAGVLVVCPTGWGKSLVYQVPALIMDGISIIVSPLISLMKDQVDKLRMAGINVAMINSSMTEKQARDTLVDVVSGRVKIIYVSPERFRNEGFNRVIESLSVGLFAVDEAHCISRWGHDFRPAYASLGAVIRKLKPRTVMALTATATTRVQDDICESMGMPSAKRFVRGVYRPNLELGAIVGMGVRREEAIAMVVNDSAEKGNPTGIIYAATRKETEYICGYLTARQMQATYYHGGMNHADRTSVQAQWAENGGTIVATCAFGMGIDRPDVRFVIHSGLSPSVEDWYQEVGRAGRDGQPSSCLSLWDTYDYDTQMALISMTCPRAEDVAAFWVWLSSLARKQAAPGDEVTMVEMTQKQMARESDCFYASACVSFLRGRGLVNTEGRGKYLVSLREGATFDVSKVRKIRAEKIAALDEVVKFYRDDGCRYDFICRHFGDTSLSGQCGVCDNCKAIALWNERTASAPAISVAQ